MIYYIYKTSAPRFGDSGYLISTSEAVKEFQAKHPNNGLSISQDSQQIEEKYLPVTFGKSLLTVEALTEEFRQWVELRRAGLHIHA